MSADDEFPDLRGLLAEAAEVGRPPATEDLGGDLVRRARWRRNRQGMTLAASAVGILALGSTLVGTAGVTRAPVVANPVEAVAGQSAPSEPAAVAAPREAEATDREAPTSPTPLPSAGASGTPTPGASPSARPSPSPTPATSSAPADDGSNDGATDVGVTREAVRIVTLVETAATQVLGSGTDDDVQQAMEAFAAYAAADLGPIHGRSIEVDVRETAPDPSSARQAAREACADGFALIGSALTVDQSQAVAGVTRLSDCPDLRAELPEVAGPGDRTWRIRQLDPEQPAMGPWESWRQRDADAVGSAAWIAVDGGTRGSASADAHETWIEQVQTATSRRGYDWVLDRRVPKGDTSWYGEVARGLDEGGVNLVRLELASVDVVRLVQKLRERDYWPTFLTLAPELYLPELPAVSRDLDGAEIALDHLPWQERTANVVLARYLDWLDEVHPGVAPTSTGLYAWTAGERLVEDLRALGGAPTRAALAERWDAARGWKAGGALAPRTLTGYSGTECVAVVHIEAGEWRRAVGRPGTFTCP